MFEGRDRFFRGIGIYLIICQGSSAKFNKVLYDPVQWPPMIYKQVSHSVTSEVECAGLCQIEEPLCRAFSFLVSECLLADPKGSFSVIPLPQTMSRSLHLIPGDWLPWSDWSLCINNQNQCGNSVQGLKNRTRDCSFPNPIESKPPCPGDNQETFSCTVYCPVHGVWSKWGGWSTWTRFCGVGVQTRNRVCNNPEPRYGGSPCPNTNLDENFRDKSCRAGGMYLNLQRSALILHRAGKQSASSLYVISSTKGQVVKKVTHVGITTLLSGRMAKA
ncbi:coadhesin-like [Tigriopus californicus]|uniref:coadhesin-like n=1 Tax=Tigriopus californicus TaxID=6832 RepID=UPI0027DA4869|nr:coadhesin-like [Tigriopus californicus]